MSSPSKLTASPLSVARVVASLVTMGTITVMTVAVWTADNTLTLTTARIFVWAFLAFLVLFTAEWTSKKLRKKLRTVGGRR